jgi:fatty acid desaturase
MREKGAAPFGAVPEAELAPLPSIEWPTVGLAVVIYGGWAALTFWHASLPAWLLYPALAWLLAWHGSLQHEVLHGHPTRMRAINDAFGFPPLALWLPYALYRRSHLCHHIDIRLTDPLDDPESFYWTADLWAALSRPGRALVALQSTLLGRLLIGPAWSIGRFYHFQFWMVRHREAGVRRIWARHAVGVACVLAWLAFCGVDPLGYALAVYGGTALLLIRSFAEHRAAPGVAERIALIENAPVLGLLFLNNNLHAVHHAWPRVPWYRIPGLFRRNRARLIAGNGGLVYNGYLDVARRFLITPHDRLLHPLGRAPMTEAMP